MKEIQELKYEVEITTHSGRTMDITDLCKVIEVYESVTQLSMVAEIFVADMIGIQEHLPLIGGEAVKIIANNNKNHWLVFRGYLVSIPVEERSNMKTQLYTLQCVGKLLFYKDMEISMIWQRKKVSDIVSEIVQKSIGETLDVHDTRGYITWSGQGKIGDNLNCLLKHAFTTEQYCGYTLYQTGCGECHFHSLEKLWSADKAHELYMHGVDQKVGYYGTITNWKSVKSFNLLDDQKNGALGGVSYTFDYLTKTYTTRSIDGIKSLYPFIGKYHPYTSELIDRFQPIEEFKNFVQDREFANKNVVLEQSFIYLKNRLIYNLLNQNCFSIVKPGDTNFHAGETVDVLLASTDQDKMMNVGLTGKMFVKSVKHKIMPGKYQQICMITKPLFGKREQSAEIS